MWHLFCYRNSTFHLGKTQSYWKHSYDNLGGGITLLIDAILVSFIDFVIFIPSIAYYSMTSKIGLAQEFIILFVVILQAAIVYIANYSRANFLELRTLNKSFAIFSVISFFVLFFIFVHPVHKHVDNKPAQKDQKEVAIKNEYKQVILNAGRNYTLKEASSGWSSIDMISFHPNKNSTCFGPKWEDAHLSTDLFTLSKDKSFYSLKDGKTYFISVISKNNDSYVVEIGTTEYDWNDKTCTIQFTISQKSIDYLINNGGEIKDMGEI